MSEVDMNLGSDSPAPAAGASTPPTKRVNRRKESLDPEPSPEPSPSPSSSPSSLPSPNSEGATKESPPTPVAGASTQSPMTEMSDEKKKIEEELKSLWKGVAQENSLIRNKFLKKMLMHSLAEDYYGMRAYWFSFLPLLIITAVISLIGFAIADRKGRGVEIDDQTRLRMLTPEYSGCCTCTPTSSTPTSAPSLSSPSSLAPTSVPSLRPAHSLAVSSDQKSPADRRISILNAVLSVLATFWTAINRYFNYQSQADMHRNAHAALKEIYEGNLVRKADWYMINAEIQSDFKKDTKQRDIYDKNIKKVNRDTHDLERYTTLYDSIEKGCSGSSIPPRIKQAFEVIESDLRIATVESEKKEKNVEEVHNPFVKIGWDEEQAFLRLWRRFYKRELWLLPLPFQICFFPFYIKEYRLKDITYDIGNDETAIKNEKSERNKCFNVQVDGLTDIRTIDP